MKFKKLFLISCETRGKKMKLLGISGSLTANSKTRKLVEAVLEVAAKSAPDVRTELLDLSEYNVEFCDGRKLEQYGAETREVVEKVINADAYVIATPIYQGSLSGALKNLFDLVPPSAFRHKVIGFAANGGTYHHFLVIENQLKPIAGYFHAYVTPGYVFAHNDHFNSNKEIADEEIKGRLKSLAEEIVYMSRQLTKRNG